MRHGVVDVQDIQSVVAAHLGHSDRERQRVIRILEQLIFVDDHRMEMQARRIFRQPERAFVAEEMHLMPAPRQFLAQAVARMPLPPTVG